jgi:hypothetical protein
MKNYHRIEFVTSIKLAMEQTKLSERDMFNQMFKTAKSMRINTGFSKLKEDAWQQYRKFVEYHKNFFSSFEYKQDIDM